jgi:hypothetical protein
MGKASDDGEQGDDAVLQTRDAPCCGVCALYLHVLAV